MFDLNLDGTLSSDDLEVWLQQAGDNEIGQPYLLGDANLDGFVDGLDFVNWNSNKFTEVSRWSAGDFNADGFVNEEDFNIWNDHRFLDSLGLQPLAAMRSDQDTKPVDTEIKKEVPLAMPLVNNQLPVPGKRVNAFGERRSRYREQFDGHDKSEQSDYIFPLSAFRFELREAVGKGRPGRSCLPRFQSSPFPAFLIADLPQPPRTPPHVPR